MKTVARKRACRAGAAGLAALLFALAWARMPSRPAPAPRPLSRELSDLAVACLASGEVRPPLVLLSDADLGAIVEIVGRLIGAYGQGDFDSFLALRMRDVHFADEVQREHEGELRSFCLELGVPASDLPGDWSGLLRAYWSAYYVESPVTRFLPERSVVDLHREGLGARSISAWDEDFEALCATREGSRLNHRLAMPHRRSIEQVTADAGDLCWLDLQLGFEARDGSTGWLIARFAWDGPLQEWFLHRATTILDGEVRDDRRQLVL